MKTYLFLKGLLFSILGIILFFFPSESLHFIIIFFALESIVSLLYSLFFLSQAQDSLLKKHLISTAIFQLIIALTILIFPQTIHFLLSLWVIFIAVIIAIYAVNLRILAQKAKETWFSHSFWLSLLAIVLFLLAIFLGINSFMMIITLVSLLGIGILLSGISLIIKSFRLQTIIDITEVTDEE